MRTTVLMLLLAVVICALLYFAITSKAKPKAKPIKPSDLCECGHAKAFHVPLTDWQDRIKSLGPCSECAPCFKFRFKEKV